MSKLRNMAEKELAILQEERNVVTKAIEQTEQALKNRHDAIKELDKHIAELQDFLSPKKAKGKK
jgi:septal ring factor EnvC (AmiA/AmiB activator)